MELPQERLVARLKAIAAVEAIVGDGIYPVIVPQNKKQYPAICYQVTSDVPMDDADGSSPDSTMHMRVACIAVASGTRAPYTAAWALAMAVRGDSDEDDPTGLNGWIDDEGCVWKLKNCFDEAGEIEAGTDTFFAFIVNMDFLVQWTQ